MPDSDQPPQASSAPEETPPPLPPVAEEPSAAVNSTPEAGTRWMGTYTIEGPVPWAEGEEAWQAFNPAACEKVIIVKVRTMDHMRDEAYDALHSITCDYLTHPVDSRLILEERYEVYHLPESQTLRQWMAKNRPPTLEMVVRWMKCIAEALGCMHGKYIAHCQLNPDRIFLVKSDDAIPNLVIGGLERCVRFNRKDLVPIQVDPFYAPPEAAGLFRHAGDGLCSWDWWSVGRIIQELILGRHILEHLVDHPLARNTPDEKEFAEKLLLEKAHGETKAGGVEAMPPMEKRIDLLLMGLLSSCRDARWGAEDVRKWIKGESPKERYKLPKSERLFKWRGRSYTVQEAAEVFRLEENWEHGPDQLLRKDDPDSLISFIREQPNLRIHAQKTEEILNLLNSAELKQAPPLVVREVMIAHCLHRISGGPFIWRGRRVDSGLIRELLDKEDGTGSALNTIQVLCTGVLIAPLEKLDFEAYRVLSEGPRLAVRAAEKASRMGLLLKTDLKEVARIWQLAFESPASWLERIKALKASYAASDRPDIQELFEKERGQPEETLVLAWLIPQAPKLGFVSHEEWDKREYGKYMERGILLARALFWVRLQRALEAGSWWFGRIYLLLGGWGALTAMLALAWPGPAYAPLLLLPLVSALLMRITLRSLVQPLLNSHAPDRPAWGMWDGSPRCQAEATKMAESRVPVRELKSQVEEINAALSKLTHLDPPPKLITLPPRMLDLKLLGLMSWLVLMLPSYLAIDKIRHTVNPWDDFIRVWFPKEEELEYYEPPPLVKIEFPYTVPKKLRMLNAKSSEPASEIQTKLGLRRGAVLAQGYITETIPGCLLVRVPSQEFLSFVIYDPKKGELATKNVYHMSTAPKRRNCVSMDGKTIFVLDY